MEHTLFQKAFSGIRTDRRSDERILTAMREEAALRAKKTFPVRRVAAALCAAVLVGGLAGGSLYRNAGALRLRWLNYENRGGELRFSRSVGGASSADCIIGKVRELTPVEIQRILPVFSQDRVLGFFMTPDLQAFDGTYADGALYCIEVQSADGEIYLGSPCLLPKDVFAYDPDRLDQMDVLDGTPVYGAYFVTSPNSRGEQTVVYSTVFEKDGLRAEIELSGDAADCEAVARRITDLTKTLIRADLSSFASLTYSAETEE